MQQMNPSPILQPSRASDQRFSSPVFGFAHLAFSCLSHSINAPPGGLLGIEAKQVSFSSRIANKAGCSVYIFHDKKWIEEHIYTGPRLAPVPQTPRSPLSSTSSFSEVEK
jgi:hypothetical protein